MEEPAVRKLFCPALVACLVFVACQDPANGNIIQLRDGSKLKGELVKRTTTELHLKIEGLDLYVPKRDVTHIDGKDLATDFAGMFQEQLAALEPGDAKARYELALWCGKHGLKDQMKKLLVEVTELAPWHEDANLKLGKIRHNGLWWTKEELEDKGLVLFQGEWLTKEEHDEVKDKVRYLDQWVPKKDKVMLEERKYSKWYRKYSTTHKLHDLQCDIRVLSFINRLDMSKKQMRGYMKVLARMEAERQGFLDKRHEIMSECEVAWLRLKEAAMFGVIDSFNVSGSIEGPAGMAEGGWKKLCKAYTHRTMVHTEAFMNAIAKKQKQEIMYGMCGDCHCARKTSIWEEPPESIKTSEKYCGKPRCHGKGQPMGTEEAEDEEEKEPAVDPEAMALVEEVRNARPDKLDALAQKILDLYPERSKKVKCRMMMQMKRGTMRALGAMMKMSDKDLKKKSTVGQFKTACASGGCHANLRRISSKTVRMYIGSMKQKKGMTCKQRMDQMFGAMGDMGGDEEEDDALEQAQEFIKKVRRMMDGDFREQKVALSDMVRGESEMASLGKLAGKDRSKMMMIMRPKKTKSMYTKFVLCDGRLFNLMAEKLKMSDSQVDALVASALKTESYELSDDIMFDMDARVKAGQDLYKLRCGVCHTIDKPGTAIKTKEEWCKTLKCMKHISYNLCEKECEVICDHLAKRDEKEEDEAL